MALRKETFTTEIDATVLAQARTLADADHQTVEAFVEEALVNLIRARSGVRPEVMEACRETVKTYAEVCEHLAK